MQENIQDPQSSLPDGTELPVGLTTAEVEERRAQGLVNVDKTKSGKSYGRILADNLLTFFNFVWAIVAVLMVIFRSYENMTFLFVIIPNILIATVLEIRAKVTVEKISVTTDPRVKVVRDGAIVELHGNELVTDDVMRIEMGGQILSDAVVLSGVCEVNESMLTGESVAIRKVAGDTLLAGSFLVSGGVYAKVVHVGKDNYVHRIEKAARGFKKPVSDLFRDLNRLIRWIGVLLVPTSAILYFVNLHAAEEAAAADVVRTAVLKTSGSVIGMIPAGIYLLITVTLTLSVIKLAAKKTLVQDMYSIEMLARADVLCLDKTGTITDGTMNVEACEVFEGFSAEEVDRVMAAIEGAEESINNTSRALIARFGQTKDEPIVDRVPFSSERKYSSVTFENLGTYSIGAPHFVKAPVSAALDAQIAERAKRGERVLLLVKQEDPEREGVAMAMIALSDRIRPNAAETIRRFQDQDVTVKIISGDHAATVSAIAQRVGVNGAENYLSCEGLSDEELIEKCEGITVFGRVTPEQKVLLVKTFRKNGHTVAMTGDGVNDTLALKESNCAIAMADGSAMASKISQIVLTDSDFASLPAVVKEGRRCINNVRQSAILFLMKTFFTLALTIFSICAGILYPVESHNLMLIETFIIGIAAVLLALEPNEKRIEGGFLKTVIARSVPNGIALFIPAIVTLALAGAGIVGAESRSSLIMLAINVAGFVNLIGLCRPYTKWRVAVIGLTALLTCATSAFVVLFMGDWLEIMVGFANPAIAFAIAGGTAVFAALVQLIRPALERLGAKIGKRLSERKKQNNRA